MAKGTGVCVCVCMCACMRVCEGRKGKKIALIVENHKTNFEAYI